MACVWDVADLSGTYLLDGGRHRRWPVAVHHTLPRAGHSAGPNILCGNGAVKLTQGNRISISFAISRVLDSSGSRFGLGALGRWKV